MKRKLMAILACVLALSTATALASFTAFAAGPDEEITVKTLVSTGDKTKGEIQWGESGAPDSWNGAVEEIKKDEPDGGDVILRTELDANNALMNSQWGFARESTNRSSTAYPITGLTIKWYHNVDPGFMLIFTENSGWYNGSSNYFAIWFNGTGAVLRKMDSKGEFENVANASIAGIYHSDYNYFADPETEGYKLAPQEGGFAGTQNVLEMKSEGGNLITYLNGTKLFDLTALNIVSGVINNVPTGDFFICYYGTAATGSAMKITDIYNVKSLWEEGVPSTFTKVEGDVEYKPTDAGTNQIRSKESSSFGYKIKYNTPQYFSDTTTTFAFDGTDLAQGDKVALTYTGAEKAVALTFAKKSVSTADLDITVDGESLGTAEVPFYFNGSANNVVSVKETVPFVVTVNGSEVEIGLEKFSAFNTALTDGQVDVGFEVTASTVSVLTPVSFDTHRVEVFSSIDGMTIDGDVVIKSDGDYKMAYNTSAAGYKLTYTANKLIADSFVISYKYGKYGENTGKLNITVGNAVMFSVYEKDGSAYLDLYTLNGGEKLVKSEALESWSFGYGDKSLGFTNDGGYGYLVYVDGAIAYRVDEEEGMAALDAAVASVENKMGEVSFEITGDALTAFAFCDYEYYVAKTSAGGWGQGAIPNSEFGYDADDNTVFAFGSSSYLKNVPVIVDGFTMTFKTFAKSGSSSPNWALAPSTKWYSDVAAIMFAISKKSDTKATFSIMYTCKIDGTYLHVETGSENRTITSFSVDWNWNNGVSNTISLGADENGVWRWTVNGTVLVPEGDDDYGDYIAELYGLFGDEKTAYVQIFGGSQMVWNIGEISDYIPNADPVFTAPELKDSYAVGETVSLTLDDLFADENGDVLTYVLSEDTPYGKIENGVYTFTADEAGVYTVTFEAYDGKGGMATGSVIIVVENKPATDNTGDTPGGSDGSSCSGSMAGGAAVAFIALAAAVCFKKKHD